MRVFPSQLVTRWLADAKRQEDMIKDSTENSIAVEQFSSRARQLRECAKELAEALGMKA